MVENASKMVVELKQRQGEVINVPRFFSVVCILLHFWRGEVGEEDLSYCNSHLLFLFIPGDAEGFDRHLV